MPRTFDFKKSYSLHYGLMVVSRTPNGKVNAAKCRFCLTFGREARHNLVKVRKTGRMRKDDLVFSKRFRADMFTQHHNVMHPTKWAEYKSLSDREKLSFFDVQTPHAETIPAHFEQVEKFVCRIAASIIDDAIVKLFVSDDSQHGYRNSVLQLLDRDEHDEYKLTINNMMQFDMVVQFVSKGLSFRQTQESIRVAQDVGGNPNLNGVTEHVVRRYVQASIAVNLQHIRKLVLDSRTWAYSIAFDTATNRENAYLDVRMRLCLGSSITNVHLLAIPIHESHTGEHIFNLTSNLLHSLLGQQWHRKLLSAATYGASNMTGRIQGAVRRFSNVALPGFFRVWCANHQLDLAIQGVMETVLQHSFRTPLLSVISYLRRQTTLRSAMGSTCPAVCQTRWMSLGSSTKWLTRHRACVVAYMEEKSAACLPTNAWWVLTAAVRAFMVLVDECAISLQGRNILLCEQSARFQKLQDELRTTIGMEGPITGLNLLTTVGEATVAGHASGADGIYIVRKEAVAAFMEDCSLDAAEDMSDLSGDEREEIEQTVAQLFLTTVVKVGDVCALRSSANTASGEQFPPILPSLVFDLRARDFFAFVKMQRDRLLVTFPSAHLVGLEEEFRAFKRYVSASQSARDEMEKYSSFMATGDTFSSAWAPFKGRFKKLMGFFGGLATVFPSTASVESDFLSLQL